MISNSNFLVKEIPKYHPIIQKYDRLEFWREQKRRCIEGYWFGGKWMPPELYYYVNFHTITFEDGISRGTGRPWLRDIEWEKAYIYAEATGFSGFELDNIYTCHRWYGPEKDKALRYGWITQDELKKKKYISAREYLRKLHPASLGKPLYQNEAQHIIDLESRGGGKSFWASGCIAHNFLFDGARDYDEYLAKKAANTPMKSEGIVGAINAIYSNDLLAKVKVAFEYLPDKQIINVGHGDEIFPSPLAVSFTGSLAPSRFIIASKSGSILHHRTFGDNPLAANATRPNRVWLDEVGFMDNIKAAWEGIESTQASAQFKRLTIHGMGTGGLTSGGAALYTQEMFYNAEAYGALVFDDIWENKGKIGYFLPGEYTLNKFKKGENFDTDFKMAKQYIDEERDIAAKSGSMSKLMGTIINKPQKPSEIFLRAEGSFFQVAELKMTLAELESTNSILNATYKYEFLLKDNKVIPKIVSKMPIREFPLPKNSVMDAPVEVFELPKKLPDGSIPDLRYIAGWDPVSSDGNEDTERSLQSMFIFDTWTSKIVAEYTARTYLHEDFYEQARRLLLYYNARCNYEKNIKGPYAYFKNTNSLHLLIETPEILKDMSLATSKATVGNNSLGTHTTVEITNWGLSLIKKWLKEKSYEDENKRNVEVVKSPGLIKELISYNPQINVDRIMAMVMVMIYREDIRRITDMTKNESIVSKTKDPFWDRAFSGKSKIVKTW